MGTKRRTNSNVKPKAKPKVSPARLHQQASDDEVDGPPADSTGQFRIVSAISRAQVGHAEDDGLRFPNESLVMAAQRDGFREAAPEELTDEAAIDDDVSAAERKARRAMLAERARLARGRR